MQNIIDTFQKIGFTAGDSLLELSYLIAALLFVFGLKRLSHPETARRGNFYAALGMLLAMATTILLHKDSKGAFIPLFNTWIILASIAVGSVLGVILARKIKMTAMPQLVSFLNATGGAASALVAFLEFPRADTGNPASVLVTLLGLSIGSVAFSGSMVAYGKLDGKIGNLRSNAMKYFNLLMLLIITIISVYIISSGKPADELSIAFYVCFAVSLIYGVLFVLPIGGADMPVVISLLNSFTGLAASMAGFIYNNKAMILGGILVGAAGTILTLLMCRAMNRSLFNVILGSFGVSADGAGSPIEGTMKEITLSDAAVMLRYSHSVVIIPGYGLATAQAQHACHELDELLSKEGVDVRYAIHPVAGRMPGHMNVLLAEADVPYSKLFEMDQINPEMPNVDVAVIIGANDVVNPSAAEDPSSPIYGMPIIKASEAKNIIVMKRGTGSGYAGIENPLFFNDKARMLFGNAKDSLQKLIGEIKSTL